MSKISSSLESIKATLLKEIQELQQKKALALQELNTVEHQIADQREGKNIVRKEQSTMETRLTAVEGILCQTEKILSQEQASYSSLTERRKKEKANLSYRLQAIQKELAEYEGKEVIDIDELNRGYKKQLEDKKNELEQVNMQLRTAQNDIELIRKEKEKFESYRDKELQHIEGTQEALRIREQSLEAYRKLLHNEE